MFDELFQMGVQFIDVVVLVGRDPLPLEGLDEAFAEGVVVRITGPAHAGQDAVKMEQGRVLYRGILDAAIGVMHRAGAG